MPDTLFQTYMRHSVVQSDESELNRLEANKLKDIGYKRVQGTAICTTLCHKQVIFVGLCYKSTRAVFLSTISQWEKVEKNL